MQGTAARIASIGGPDDDRDARIERLLVSRKIDICMVQEPPIDGKGVYLLDRHPYRVIASGCQSKATIIVTNQDIDVLSLKQLSTPHNAVAAIAMGDTRLTVKSKEDDYPCM
ncbi:hypothetical protein QTP88_016905 [Uroleucon formosanum]